MSAEFTAAKALVAAVIAGASAFTPLAAGASKLELIYDVLIALGAAGTAGFAVYRTPYVTKSEPDNLNSDLA